MSNCKVLQAACVVGAVAALGHSAVASAQAYPTKPVRVVVAFAAGGFADRNGRLVSQRLTEQLGQNFVVDNRGGAGGTVGAKLVSEAPADGYTLLVTTAASSITPAMYSNLGFDMLKDFAPIANTVSSAGILSALATHPARDLRDLIQKSKGRRITFGTAGVGTSSHIGGDYILRVLAKLDATHIPFKGGAPAIVAVLGGQIELLNSSSGALVHIQSGKMKGLAVASLTRVKHLPNVPTVAEQGFPGFQERSWVAFFAPARTPRAIVERLNKEINVALNHKQIIDSAESEGVDIHLGSVEEFTRFFRSEMANWDKMVKSTGVKGEL